MNTVRLLQIGIGFHARRIYVPTLERLRKDGLAVELCAGVDICAAKPVIDSYLADQKIDIEMIYFDTDAEGSLSAENVDRLDKTVSKYKINGVIISTDPLAHKMFALWALSRGLHILMDKPITTRTGVNSSIDQAQGLIKDYEDIHTAYNVASQNKDIFFSVMVQRRYEGGYQKVFELIKEVGVRFNAPVTSIQASHSDGVWIFPDEVVDQKSHPYSTGYGKNSHSGYHIFDVIWKFYMASGVTEKYADAGEAMTSFLSPRGLLKQFGQNDFASYFPDYNMIHRRTDKELYDLFEQYGEIDAFSIIRLMKQGETICNISTNLIHNGFSRRAWAVPNSDLYKGNGRVKHQTYSIQQGPFQNIQIHQYQSNDEHDTGIAHGENVGGNNHFDIFVFRNAAMFDKGEPSFISYKPKDLNMSNSYRLSNESAKDTAIMEFIQCILGNLPKSEMKSSIESHAVPVKIMSAIYQSQTQQVNNMSPIAHFNIKRGDINV